tara:strand:+ start:2064 stop:2792 length:729 start_codon:yes stop_codon:yes gene_type:complete
MSEKEYACISCGHPLSKSGYYTAKKRGYCRQCKNNSQGGEVEVSSIPPLSHSSNDDSSPPPIEEDRTIEDYDDNEPEWLNFEPDESEEITESIPTALKMATALSGDPGSRTKKEVELAHQTNLEILKMGLGGVDVLITKYGRAVTLDKEYLCKHSESDKELVAHAQYRFLLEKGIDPSSIVSTGTIATALTGYYVLPPIMKVRKKAKVKLFKNAGKIVGVLRKIPVIGRLFGGKKKNETNDS